LQTLRGRVDSLQKALAANSVEHALETVRQLASRPRALMDNYALLAALEQLADVARDNNHRERKKYNAIFRQCRLLVRDGLLSSVITRLLENAEEKLVANQIQKLLKADASPASVGNPPRPHPYGSPSGYSGLLLSSGPRG
jgi:hypothetical protein